MAKNYKGEEIEVGDIVSVNFKVVHAHSNSIELRRIEGNGPFTCKSDSGEISIVKKFEKPLVIGDFIQCKGPYGEAIRPKMHQIVAFDGDECVYKRFYRDGSFNYDHAPTANCKRDLRVTPKDDV